MQVGVRSRNGIVVRAPIDRLRSKLRLDEATGCMEWAGALDRKGYARLAMGDGVNALAHRVAFEAARGPIPAGLTLDHLCRNKRCCNAAHLEAVTAAENTRRSNLCRDTSHCPKGHLWTPESTYYHNIDGKRRCLPCRQERERMRSGRPS